MSYATAECVDTLLAVRPRGMSQLKPHVAVVSRRSFGGQL